MGLQGKLLCKPMEKSLLYTIELLINFADKETSVIVLKTCALTNG